MTIPTPATIRSLADVATEAVHIVLTPGEARAFADRLAAAEDLRVAAWPYRGNGDIYAAIKAFDRLAAQQQEGTNGQD